MLVCALFWFIRAWDASGSVEDEVGDIVACGRGKAPELDFDAAKNWQLRKKLCRGQTIVDHLLGQKRAHSMVCVQLNRVTNHPDQDLLPSGITCATSASPHLTGPAASHFPGQ
jgi:hypothetical protein